MAAVLADEKPSASLVARAFAAPHELWKRALALEGCAVHLDRTLHRSMTVSGIPPTLQRELSEATARAIRHALSVPAQLDELSTIARESGIRLMVLKGAARLLGGAVPGSRSLSDIDVLAAPNDALRLHALLRDQLGYIPAPAAPEHHLPTLSRVGALPVEVHIQLGPRPTGLDERIWRDASKVHGTDMVIPSYTGALMHALEHGALVHWAVRYRLRDLLDVAEAWTAHVDGDEVSSYLRTHPQRAALETLLGAARRFSAAIPASRRPAWRTVRRVARVRHVVAAHVRSPALAQSLCIAAGVLAEASPKALLRPAQLALFGVTQATSDRMPGMRGQPNAA